MPYYLSEYIGAGTRTDSFRPRGSEQPGWTAIDLRPDPSRQDGNGLNACLLHTPAAFNDPNVQFLADDKLETLTNPQKNFLTNKLGVDLSSPTLLRDIVATIMTAPPGNGWKAIKPGFLRWEVWLGGELLWSAPRISGGASDDFNRANETPLASPWVTPSNGFFDDFNLVGNAVVSSGGDANGYYTAAASSGDQYAELSSPGPSSISGGGPAVRIATTNNYLFDQFASITLGEIRKWTAPTDSVIANGTITRANPLRIEAEGSTIRILSNGALSASVTDSSFSTGQPGALWYHTGSGFDLWSGGDLAPPAPAPSYLDYNNHPKFLLAGRSTV